MRKAPLGVLLYFSFVFYDKRLKKLRFILSVGGTAEETADMTVVDGKIVYRSKE